MFELALLCARDIGILLLGALLVGAVYVAADRWLL